LLSGIGAQQINMLRATRRAFPFPSAACLFIEQTPAVEAPRGTVMQIEVPVRAEIFPGKVFPVLPGDQPRKLFVGQLFEELGRDGLPDSQLSFFHGRAGGCDEWLTFDMSGIPSSSLVCA
jgi:hypothetical protein